MAWNRCNWRFGALQRAYKRKWGCGWPAFGGRFAPSVAPKLCGFFLPRAGHQVTTEGHPRRPQPWCPPPQEPQNVPDSIGLLSQGCRQPVGACRRCAGCVWHRQEIVRCVDVGLGGALRRRQLRGKAQISRRGGGAAGKAVPGRPRWDPAALPEGICGPGELCSGPQMANLVKLGASALGGQNGDGKAGWSALKASVDETFHRRPGCGCGSAALPRDLRAGQGGAAAKGAS